MAIKVYFSGEDWARIRRDWTTWWAGELERPMVMIEGREAPPPPPPLRCASGKGSGLGARALPEAPHFVTNLPLEMPAEEVVARYEADLEARRFYGDAWPRWFVNYGPGIVAGFLGARVRCAPHTVWFEPPRAIPIGDLHLAYDPGNAWWQRIQEVTRLAAGRWRGQAGVCFTDLGGNLDVLASLRTAQQLLLDLYDAPEEVERLAGEITRLWLRYYDALDAIIEPGACGTTPWAPIWSPGRCYMLQCDFSYMLSPRMFERFVLPDLATCCDAIVRGTEDHAFYHLDGKGQIAHLDMLLSLERLRGIQWVPGDGAPPPEAWPDLLKRIRDGGKLCQLSVSPQGARTIVRELGGRGFALAINQVMSRADAEDLLRTLAAEDAGR